MRTTPGVLLLSILASACLLGCSDNAGSGPLLTVSPATLPVNTGDNAATFQAVLSNGATGPVSWTLDPATGLGSISTSSGLQTSYQPPPLGTAAGTVKLRAQAGSLGFTATITVSASTTGSLTITVTGLPTPSPASVTVTGPSGSSVVSIQTSTTLTKLPPGSYTVTAAEITLSSATVNSKYSAPPATATVAANAVASATVTYASEPGYGLLWVSSATTETLLGFDEAGLFANTGPALTPGTNAAAQGIAFDASGAMWASLKGTPGSVVRYAAADLATASQVSPLVPTATLTDQVSDPAGVAIGPDGRIWVANCTTNALTAYALTGGSAEIVIRNTANAAIFKCPRGIAFDAPPAGNLWVANRDGSVERFPSAQISASNSTAAPDTTLTAPSGASQPYGVALDKTGNLWVAYCGGSQVARFNSGSFTTAAAVLTQVTASNPLTLDCPVALALDNSGRLWAANAGTSNAGGTLSAFAATDIAGSGTSSPTPRPQLTGVGITVGGLAFNPTSTDLPIRH
jgi:sugar lactone lactonase YvrE